jgi:hypothetical protein
MWSKNGKWMLPSMLGALVLALVSLSACAEIQVVDTVPSVDVSDTSTPPISPADGERNLAVLAVDFDPPLSYEQLIARRQTVALLVAIENTGTRTERNVLVRVQLSTEEDSSLLLTQGASVASIAPGEIQIVRFARLGEIPYHQSYRLEVAVDAVEWESDTSDNKKAFDIHIYQD